MFLLHIVLALAAFMQAVASPTLLPTAPADLDLPGPISPLIIRDADPGSNASNNLTMPMGPPPQWLAARKEVRQPTGQEMLALACWSYDCGIHYDDCTYLNLDHLEPNQCGPTRSKFGSIKFLVSEERQISGDYPQLVAGYQCDQWYPVDLPNQLCVNMKKYPEGYGDCVGFHVG